VTNAGNDTVEIDELNRFFVSKEQADLDLYEATKNDKFKAKAAKFLSALPAHAISYTSWPRSGNTFLRTYLENITGIATGSDQLMQFSLNISL